MTTAFHLRAAGLAAAAAVLVACNSTPQAVQITAASSVRSLVEAPDTIDQPSFAARTGRPPALSLQGLFHPTYNVPTDPSKIRTLLVTGDVIPARGVAYFAAIRHDYLWPFRATAEYTKNSDITYINLEAPLFAGCPVSPAESFTFCGDPRFVNGFTYMGADVVNLANNHTSNYGAAGITSTVQLLQQNGMQVSGLGPVAVIDVRGLKFGFIGFNGVGRAIDKLALKEGIARARQLADVVVVQFHWGKEYERQPKPDPGVPTPDDPVTIGTAREATAGLDKPVVSAYQVAIVTAGHRSRRIESKPPSKVARYLIHAPEGPHRARRHGGRPRGVGGRSRCRRVPRAAS